ncbi:MAG: flippase [Actinomycetota bacterium]|nr:flippase [Actinomycetota bacterium]
MTAPATDGEVASSDVLDTPDAGPRAIRGSATRAGGYVAGALLGVISAPLLVRHLGVADFGRYFTIVSLMALVAGVTDVGLGAVALREYSQRAGAARDEFMRTILGARIVLTVAGVVVATGFAAVAGYEAELVLGAALSGIGVLLAVVAHTFAVSLTAQLRAGWLTGVELGGQALAVALIVVLVLSSADIVAFLAVTIPTGLVTVAIMVALTRGRVPRRPSLNVGELRRLVRETLPLAAATIMGTLYARIVIIIMSLIATDLVTGYFSTAYRVVDVAVGIPFALVGMTFPVLARASRDDHVRLRYVLQRVLEVALILGVWMTLAVALSADLIADLLVGSDEAEPVADVLRLQALILLPAFLNIALQTTLVALHRHRALFVVNGIALALIVALTFSLVVSFGARGAACAVIVGDTALMAMSAVALLRSHPHLRPQLRAVPRVAVATVAALLVALAVPVADALGVLLATVAYFGTLAALRAIPTELRDAFTSRAEPG